MSIAFDLITKSTKRAYNYDIDQFLKSGYSLPTTPADLSQYLIENAKVKNSRTLKRHIVGLRYWHKANNYPDPTKDDMVKSALKYITRQYGCPRRKAPPLTVEQLKRIAATTPQGIPQSLHIRNLALITLGFFGAFRISELASLKWTDLTFTEDGLEVKLQHSKTDQYHSGQIVRVPAINSPVCPVTCLKKLYKFATNDSVFGICSTQIYRVIKQYLGKKYSGHSLRRGFATLAAQKGMSMKHLMTHGRWKSVDVALTYMEEAQLATQHAVKALFK
jgi:integrase